MMSSYSAELYYVGQSHLGKHLTVMSALLMAAVFVLLFSLHYRSVFPRGNSRRLFFMLIRNVLLNKK